MSENLLPRSLDRWATLADVFAQHQALTYAKLARACALDPLIGDLGPPLVLLHVVRLAFLQGRAQDPWSGDFDAFARDLRQLKDEVAAAVSLGLVQFTEPLRLADVLPGLFMATQRYPGRPLRLVDIGACAGLQLMPECFEILYPRVKWSPATAKASLVCDLDVPPALIEQDLCIADRVGIDLSPVNPAASGSAAYLRSFVWPGDATRELRLQAALHAVASCVPPIHAGTVMDMLPTLLNERVSPAAVSVVIDSATSHYLSNRDNFRLGRLLDQMAARGPLLLISRGGAIENNQDLPASVRLLDLSYRWRCAYAATDLLSERTQWLMPQTHLTMRPA